MRPLLKRAQSTILICFPAFLLACGDSTSPGVPVAGDYTAITFLTRTPPTGNYRDELQAGGSLTLSLNSNGMTSGHLHIAANGATPAFDADMAGTWTLNGDVVTFTQAADTFVRNMAFTVQRAGRNVVGMAGDQIFSQTRINVTLAHE